MSRNSDSRKITNVRNMAGALAKVDALQTVYYKHVDEEAYHPEHVGWVAQDFAKVFPDLIKKREIDTGDGPIKDAVFQPFDPKGPADPVGGFHITSYEALVPVLCQAIKELHLKVQALDTQIKTLKGTTP